MITNNVSLDFNNILSRVKYKLSNQYDEVVLDTASTKMRIMYRNVLLLVTFELQPSWERARFVYTVQCNSSQVTGPYDYNTAEGCEMHIIGLICHEMNAKVEEYAKTIRN